MNAILFPPPAAITLANAERFDDGSRELTDAERLRQIDWEMQALIAEHEVERCEMNAAQIELDAGDKCFSERIARHLKGMKILRDQMAGLRHEIKNLQARK